MGTGYLAQQIVNGLILGSMYALVAIGFSLIYGIIRLINFAHGDVVMIGAFITLGLMQLAHVPFPLIEWPPWKNSIWAEKLLSGQAAFLKGTKN